MINNWTFWALFADKPTSFNYMMLLSFKAHINCFSGSRRTSYPWGTGEDQTASPLISDGSKVEPHKISTNVFSGLNHIDQIWSNMIKPYQTMFFFLRVACNLLQFGPVSPCVGILWWDVLGPSTYQMAKYRYYTSKSRARRVAEVSRVKDCDTIGSKDKVCL